LLKYAYYLFIIKKYLFTLFLSYYFISGICILRESLTIHGNTSALDIYRAVNNNRNKVTISVSGIVTFLTYLKDGGKKITQTNVEGTEKGAFKISKCSFFSALPK